MLDKPGGRALLSDEPKYGMRKNERMRTAQNPHSSLQARSKGEPMRSLIQAIAVCMALAAVAGGCAVMVRHHPQLGINQLREAPPTTVAVLPFDNESDEPMAGRAARDALFYALADRGFRMLDLREIDSRLADRSLAAALRRGEEGVDAQAAGRLFGAEAIALGRVIRAKPLNARVATWTRLTVQVWLIDTRSQKVVWTDRATALVRLFNLPRRGRSLTPAESRQAPLLRLCRSFDSLWRRLARDLPSVVPEPEVSQLAIRRVVVRPTRPIVSAGDRVDIVVEGTRECVAKATLGTLDEVVPLEESSDRTRGVYRGSYTVQPGDRSDYCRVGVTLESGTSLRRKIASARSAFIIDTVAPDPPTALAYDTRPNGVVLTWDPPASSDIAHYLLYRSETTTGAVRPLARPVRTRHVDRSARGPSRSLYFVKAIDHAGNPSSSSAELVVDLPAPGPSSVGGIIQGEARWTAFGGPYRLALDVDVAPGARLVIEPGTRIEIPPGMEITVRGTVEAIGRANEPIRLVGTEASRGFHLAHAKAVLRASYVEISGARSGIEVIDGECYLDQVTLRDNQTGLDSQGAQRLVLAYSTVARNRYGVVAGPRFEIRSCEFIQNDVGLRVVGDGGSLDRCLFNNIRLDITKLGRESLVADGNTFWTSDPSKLFRHLWGNVICRSILVRRWPLRRERAVQFEPAAICLTRGEEAARDFEWERALRAYESALLQERNYDYILKALKMYKQIVEAEGPLALERAIDFCHSAVLVYPNKVELLRHLAELHFRQGNARTAREICTRILRINPNDEFAKKSLAAATRSP
ncbi:hypothetical protein AMJ85_02870 [candidate division BRC1 bacterium SM23_51]|nr:MAG: hypothetical protein AMJ85_02870 [candidate division BRC1 bacterium SM23_51]